MAEVATGLQVVAVRFQKLGKLYYFDASRVPDLQVGEQVIVSTSRGRELGEVVSFVTDPGEPPAGGWKPIERRATAKELAMANQWKRRELEATIEARAKAAELGVRGVKIVKAEYAFDGSRLTFLYNTEQGEKVNLERLRKALQRRYRRSKVQMRQIGPRDVAKVLGGMGACGLVERCCSMFLTQFSPISIRMAKAQGISLDPHEITGMCGRLRCCLVYEYEQYVEARKQLPKPKKRVITPLGEGKVVDVLPLKQAVIVQLEGGKRAEFLKHEIQPYDELKALEEKAKNPCGRHESGGCTCGKAEGKM